MCLAVAEEGLEELCGVGAGHGLVVGLVVLGLGVLDKGQPLPIGHQPFHEVVGFFVVGGRELRGVGRIEIGQVGLGLRQEIVDVLAGRLALLAVVENEGVDAGHVLAQPLLEFLRGVLALAVAGRRREMPEAALAGHAGLAQGEEGDVFLEARELVTLARIVSIRPWTPLAKKMPLKLSRTKVPALGLSASSASRSSSESRTLSFSMIARAA